MLFCTAAGEGRSPKVTSEQRAGWAGGRGGAYIWREDGFRQKEQPKQNPEVGAWVAFLRNKTTVARAYGRTVGDEVTTVEGRPVT